MFSKNRMGQCVSVVFLLFVAEPGASGQSAANQVTHTQLEFRGITQIGGLVPPRTVPSTLTFSVRNHPDPDAGEQRGSDLALPIPSPHPIPIGQPGRNAFGFNALNSIDSALVNEGFVGEPPDQGLCVGNGFVVETINSAFAVYNPSSGALLAGPIQMNAFFGLDFAQFTSDPRCFFDKTTRHWFATILQIDIDPKTGGVTNHSHGLIAVSTSDDPTSTFNIFRLDTTNDGTNGTQNHTGCPCFGDQPLLGTDENGFFYSTNEFSITALTGAGQVFSNGAQIYALSKELLAAGESPTVVHFGDIPLTTGHVARSVQPAQSAFTGHGDIVRADHGVEYFVSHLNFTHTLDNRIAVWAVSDTRTLKNANPHVDLAKVVINSEVYGDPPPATQKAGANPFGASQNPPQPEGALDPGDTRMQQVYFADGLLWTGLTTIVQQGENPLAGAAYFIIRPEFGGDKVRARIERQGYVTVENENIIYPAIAANEDGKAVITFTVSGPDFFPSAAYARLSEDHGVGKVRIIGLGAFPDDGFSMYPPFSNGVGRWGDYSAAAVDESGNLWFATEYTPPTLSGFPQGLGVNFGTFIGTLNVGNDD